MTKPSTTPEPPVDAARMAAGTQSGEGVVERRIAVLHIKLPFDLERRLFSGISAAGAVDAARTSFGSLMLSTRL